MKVAELIKFLETCQPDDEVKIAHQPNYPLAFDLVTMVRVGEAPVGDDEGLELAMEMELVPKDRDRLLGAYWPDDEPIIEQVAKEWWDQHPAFANVVWLGTSESNAQAPYGPYAPRDAWNEDLNG